MRLQYASDLHLEIPANRDFVLAGALEPAADYLLLAGDISFLSDWHKADAFWDWCARSFQHTWIVPGNHDYHADRLNLLGLASLLVPVRPNVTYANNICVHVEEVSLVLTTLWSAITLQKTEIEEEVVDYRQIYFDGKTISTKIVKTQYYAYVLIEALCPCAAGYARALRQFARSGGFHCRLL